MRPVTLHYLPGEGVLHEALGAALVTVAFLVVFVLAQWWQARFHPPVEWTRKLIHVGGGVVAAFFPWLFFSHWTVLALAAGLMLALRWARTRGWLPALHQVERASMGEFYYPLGVYLLFVVARAQPLFYLIALGALVLADTAAAILGQRYGRLVFADGGEAHSVEGSAAFFGVTFLAVHLPLLLLSDLPRAATVLVAVQLALLVTSFEAISRRGNDNLIVPLSTYYLLLKLTARSVTHIGFQLVAQLAILLATLVIARRTRFLTFGGAIAVHLVLYAAFSLGNPSWTVAPLLALVVCIALDHWFGQTSGRRPGGRQVRAVYYVSVVPVLLLFADNTFATLMPVASLRSGHPFHAPFVGALGAQVAILLYQALRLRPGPRRTSVGAALALGAAGGFTAIAAPGLLAGSGPGLGAVPTPSALLTALALCALAPPLYLTVRRLVPTPTDVHRDLRLQALAVLVALWIVLPVHLTRLAAR